MKWFKKRGWFYLPISITGWFITIITILLCAWFFIVIDKNSHSVSDSIINFFPFGVSFFAVRFWIAINTSED